MKHAAILFSFLAITGISNAQHEQENKRLESLSWEWMNAWKDQDMGKLDEILAPDFRLLAMINGELVKMDRTTWLNTVKHYIPVKYRYYDFDIRFYGNTAIVQSLFEQQAILRGVERSGTFQVTDVWVKGDTGWRVVHRHTTLKPAENQVK